MLMWQIANARREKGILQSQLAEMAGYSPTEVCRWERGRRAPSLDQALDLAAALGHRVVLMPEHWIEQETSGA